MQTTTEGYLISPDAWTKQIALNFSAQENITLNDDHWKIIESLRDFYKQYAHFPTQRVLLKLISAKLEINYTSIQFAAMFPKGPRQLARIAGLPKPARCT